MKLKDLNLTKDEQKELKKWVNGWGRFWKRELQRFYDGQDKALDALYTTNKQTLLNTKEKVNPVLNKLTIPYSGPDRD